MGAESLIERKVCRDALTDHGIPNVKMTISSENGWPDRMFLIPGGRPYLIEFKSPGQKPRPKQVHVHEMLRGLGYDVDTFDAYEPAIEAILQKAKHASSK